MQTPPPSYYSPAPKKSKVGLIVAIAIGVIALCCVLPTGILGFLGLNAAKGAFGMVGCGIGISNARDALLAYAKDHKGKLPAAATWQDDIAPYITKQPPTMKDADKTFTVPGAASDFCDQKNATGIAFNKDLAGKSLTDVKDPSGTIILFEVAGRGRNKSLKYTEQDVKDSPKLISNLPRGWVIQPIKGESYVRNAQGQVQPIPNRQAIQKSSE